MEHFYQNIGENWFTYANLYKDMIQKFGDNSHFVEIGSWRGRSASFMAVEIINSGYNIKFDCVDTWKGSIEHKEHDLIINDTLYDEFINNISKVSHIINPIREESVNAAKNYSDNSLDFVFIDASHEYIDVFNDIKSWFPKIKKGGILAGHDIFWGGVNSAVNEFFKEKKFDIIQDYWVHEKD